MKKSKFLMLVLTLTLLFSMNALGASYYSYNNVGLNYGKSSGGFYGVGKNGYKWVKITSVKGNKVRYRYAKFTYSAGDGHNVIKAYGKTYTASLTGSARYYTGASWSRLNSCQAYRYSYHSKAFKNLKILVKSTKRNVLGSSYARSSYYIKISRGKIKTIVSPVIYAM